METKEVLKEQEKENAERYKLLLFEDAMLAVIEQLRRDQKFSAVRTYGSTLRSVVRFMVEEDKLENESDMGMQESVKSEFCNQPAVNHIFQLGVLKQYQEWLRRHRAEWSTVSTYMRTLHAVYNRLVESNKLSFIPRLFADVYTKVEPNTKRALAKEQMQTLLSVDVRGLPAPIRSVLAYFLLTFLLRGMPFIDLAHLLKKDLKNGRLVYCRHKTGRQMSVCIPQAAQSLLEEFRDSNPNSIYLFPILESEAKDGRYFGRNMSNEQVHECYLRALRRYNKRLIQIAALLLPGVRLSSYTPRHTWATLAFYKGITVGIISKALGHSSIKVTDTYLKPFEDRIVDSANDELILSLMQEGQKKVVA